MHNTNRTLLKRMKAHDDEMIRAAETTLDRPCTVGLVPSDALRHAAGLARYLIPDTLRPTASLQHEPLEPLDAPQDRDHHIAEVFLTRKRARGLERVEPRQWRALLRRAAKPHLQRSNPLHRIAASDAAD